MIRAGAVLLLGLGAIGCQAKFVDLRDMTPGQPMDAAQPRDLGAGAADLGVAGDFGSAPDLTGMPNLEGGDMARCGAPAAGEGEVRLGSGCLENRAGHFGSGGVSLIQRTDGALELRFGADVVIQDLPGPYVFLTSRSAMGNAVNNTTDINLGFVRMLEGAQSYPVPGVDEGRRYAFVYCLPYRVEIARALLSP